MRTAIYLICLILLGACKSEETSSTVVVDNLDYFQQFSASCEVWLENQFGCSDSNCFSSASVEIVGIDTSNPQQYKVYAWAWSQLFIKKDGQYYAGQKKLLISRFTVDAISRDHPVQKAYFPDEEQPIQEQLEQQQFPETLIDEYFTNQSEQVERLRIQSLSEKANDKFRLYLDNAYIPVKLPADTTAKDSI